MMSNDDDTLTSPPEAWVFRGWLRDLLKYLVIPIVYRSYYLGLPITKYKTQHGTQLSHTYKP